MKKVNKGDYGYIRYEKKKRLLITVPCPGKYDHDVDAETDG